MKALLDEGEVRRTLVALIEPGNVWEIRCLDAQLKGNWRNGTVSGYFDNIDDCLSELRKLTCATGIYVTLNPVDRALLARRKNRLDYVKNDDTTKDQHIVRRRRLLVDVDADRPSGVSATDAEKEAATEKAGLIWAFLRERAWPAPVIADSGNGAHLVYSVDLPCDDQKLIENVLKALADRFDGDGVKIDRSVHNTARIARLYGTLAAKGDNTKERPHRLSKILQASKAGEPVRAEQLRALVDELQSAKPESPKKKTADSAQIEARKQIATKLLGEIDWETEATGFCICPGKTRHTAGDNDRDCKIYLESTVSLHCFHNSCHEIVEIIQRELRKQIWQAEKPADLAGPGSREQAEPLPPMEDAAEAIEKPIVLPDEVIEGLLYRGDKAVIGGASKSNKTWLQIDVAVSIATGTLVLGQWETKRGRVLYINLELPAKQFWKRVKTICNERQIKLEKRWLTAWNLRGYACALTMLLPKILSGIGENQFDLIIIDPIYKVLGQRNENSAGDIATLLNEIESLAVQTGAAVLFGAHYSKGNQSAKEAMDRVGGSGVFARDPDSIINFTKHEEPKCFTVDAILRNHPPIEPFVVRWEFPLFVVDSLLDPADLKQAGSAKDKPEPKTKEDMLELVPEQGSIAFNVLIRLGQDSNIGVNKGRSFISELIDDGVLFRWLVKRPRTNDEVRISRHEQPEEEKAK